MEREPNPELVEKMMRALEVILARERGGEWTITRADERKDGAA